MATGSSEAAGGAGGGGARVFFQSPRGGAGGSPGSSREDSAALATAAAAGQVQQQQQQQRRHQQGKVTVKYDRKELRKRLVLEEWIVEQLGQLYGCEVPGAKPGGSGASLGARCPHRISPRHQLSAAHRPDSWGPSAGNAARRVLFPGCPLAPGRSTWDPLPGFSCRAPESRAPPWGRWGGLGLARLFAFSGVPGAPWLQLQPREAGLRKAHPSCA